MHALVLIALIVRNYSFLKCYDSRLYDCEAPMASKRSRYRVLTNKYSVYFFYVMKKLYHDVALDTHCIMLRHCGYLLSNRSQSHRTRQTIHVASSICPLSASYFRGGYVPPPISSSYHPAPRLLGFHSSSSSPSSSPNALRLRGIFFAFLRFFLPGPRYTVGV